MTFMGQGSGPEENVTMIIAIVSLIVISLPVVACVREDIGTNLVMERN